MIGVQANLRRQKPLVRLPKTHLSRLAGLNMPKYWAAT
jgi:hypothetical protein